MRKSFQSVWRLESVVQCGGSFSISPDPFLVWGVELCVIFSTFLHYGSVNRDGYDLCQKYQTIWSKIV